VHEFVAAEALHSPLLGEQALAGRAFDFGQRREVVGGNQRFQHRRAEAGRRDQPDGLRERLSMNRQAVERFQGL
jgi:hypothetical protein